jgi:hypothetical protein
VALGFRPLGLRARETGSTANVHGIPIRSRFDVQPNSGAGWEQPLRDRRCLRAVALRPEIHLGRVDLDEPDALTVPKRDRVAVGYAVDPVNAPRLRRRPSCGNNYNGRGDRQQGERGADPQPIPSEMGSQQGQGRSFASFCPRPPRCTGGPSSTACLKRNCVVRGEFVVSRLAATR